MVRMEQKELHNLGTECLVPFEHITKIIRQYGEVLEFKAEDEVKSYFTGDSSAHDGYLFWPENWKLNIGLIKPERYVYDYTILKPRVKNYASLTSSRRYPIRIIRILRSKVCPYLRNPRY